MWTHNGIQTNRVKLGLRDKASTKTAKNRNVTASRVSVRSRAAVSNAAVSKVDDRRGSLQASGGR